MDPAGVGPGAQHRGRHDRTDPELLEQIRTQLRMMARIAFCSSRASFTIACARVTPAVTNPQPITITLRKGFSQSFRREVRNRVQDSFLWMAGSRRDRRPAAIRAHQ
jgi:hypothetical protein